MHQAADFKFSRLVIVESLEAHEVPTGRHIEEFVVGLEAVRALGMPVQHVQCQNAASFRELISALAQDARRKNESPLLHVECHGDQDRGLEFANGSELGWPELSTLLVDLNKATRFNLFAIFSACYGGYFLSRFSSIEPAPCLAMVAPTETVEPFEILASLRGFYSDLFTLKDAGQAIDRLSRQALTRGHWFGQHAEFWFERVTIGYIENHCTKLQTDQRIKRMFRQAKSDGLRVSKGHLKRQLKTSHNSSLLGRFFSEYFMTDEIPENTLRFAPLRRRVSRRLEALRATDRYVF